MSRRCRIAVCIGAMFAVPGVFTALFVSTCRYIGLASLGVGAAILCFALLGALRRRVAARILQAALALCLAALLVAAGVTGARILRAAGASDADEKYLIVLGAQVQGDQPSQALRVRIDAAYAYLCAHPGAVAIVSGGQGADEQISEAACMARELEALGIDPARIWQEDRATDTRENFRFSLDLIEARTGARPDSVAFVTSSYHAYRAAEVARAAGVEASGIPAQTITRTEFANFFLREIVAVWYYALTG